MQNNNYKKAIKILKKGGIVVFPTDTVYGMGCRIEKRSYVKKLFKIRKRPFQKAVPILVSSIEMAVKYFRSPLPNIVRSLMKDYWPGGLTVVYFRNKNTVSSYVSGEGDTIGIRMPDYKNILQMIEEVGVPVIGTSANFHSKPTPVKYAQLDLDLVKLSDYVIKGECRGDKSSTVIDCTKKPWEILRQGTVKIDKKYF
jgi:L-threonylcarbamoyladenylate synthase